MRTSILAGVSALALTAMPAFAQSTTAPAAANTKVAAADDAEDPGEMMIVTGSRIARAKLNSSVPVTTLTREELTINGEVNIGDQISQLPSFRVSFGTQNSGGAIGTAGLNILDLRGQGTGRTLVLQNGRRHVTSQPGTSTVDTSHHPERAGRARRCRHRRQFGSLRFGRHRRGRQLHHEEGFRRHRSRWPDRPVVARRPPDLFPQRHDRQELQRWPRQHRRQRRIFAAEPAVLQPA